MTLEPRQLGFTWPQETTLTSPSGEKLTIRPYAVSSMGLCTTAHQRLEDLYLYCTSSTVILTEWEVKKWLAGGDEVCCRLQTAFRQIFETSTKTQLPLAQVISTLQQQGFAGSSIEINLERLVQDGYVAATQRADQWELSIVR